MNNCRSQFGWQLPVHVVLVPPCWFRRCVVFRRWFRRCFVFRRWYRWYNVNRIAFAIFWIALGSFVFARWGGYKKSSGFYSCRPPHCPIDASSLIFLAAPEAYKRGRVSDGYITLKFNKMHFNCSRHN